MTKISIDQVPLQQQKQNSGSADLARRFEWRLQWEKSQLEERQAYQQVGLQKEGRSIESAIAEQNPVGAEAEVLETQFLPFYLPESVSGDNTGSGQEQRFSSTCQINSGSSIIRETGSAAVLAAITPTRNDGLKLAVSTIPKTTQSVRAIPAALSSSSTSPGVHVYQTDGIVEVALRSVGLNGKDGVKLMSNLKKDLASLGLMLARLTLNGELVWQSDLTESHKGTSSETEEPPIDKIY
ncbi:MAG: hypothetical protein P8179_09380 [Candidatus Thiodiazotropha sp.]